MSGNLGFFDSSAVEPSSGFDPIPDGSEVVVSVKDSEVKTTKAGTGKYAALTLQVLDGQYKGRLIWWNINFLNPSAKAQEIGQGQLSSICKACAKGAIQDTHELHGIPFKVKVGIEDGMNGEKRNKVTRVLWKDGSGGGGSGSGGNRSAASSGPVTVDEDSIPF